MQTRRTYQLQPRQMRPIMDWRKTIGTLGEIHPLVKEHYDLPESPLLAAKFDLHLLLSLTPDRYEVSPLPTFPPVLEDMAVIVGEEFSCETGGGGHQGIRRKTIERCQIV